LGGAGVPWYGDIAFTLPKPSQPTTQTDRRQSFSNAPIAHSLPALRVIGRSHHAGDATGTLSLPDAIRHSSSLAVFKCSLKTHFYI